MPITVEHIREREHRADGTVIEREIRRVKTELPPRWVASELPPAAIGVRDIYQGDDGRWRGWFADENETPAAWYANCGWGTDWGRMDTKWTCFEGG